MRSRGFTPYTRPRAVTRARVAEENNMAERRRHEILSLVRGQARLLSYFTGCKRKKPFRLLIETVPLGFLVLFFSRSQLLERKRAFTQSKNPDSML